MCLSSWRLWSGDIPVVWIFVCKLCNWSAVVSAAAEDMSKASPSSDPSSFVCWEWGPSTQFLRGIFCSCTVHQCHPHFPITLGPHVGHGSDQQGAVDVAEERAAGSHCWWGMLGPCQPQPFMQTRSWRGWTGGCIILLFQALWTSDSFFQEELRSWLCMLEFRQVHSQLSLLAAGKKPYPY